MKYDIIKTDNYLLILGDTFIWESNEPYFVAEKLVDGRYDVIQIDNVNDWDTLNQYKILAHLPLNGNTLENIPLLPPLEDDVDKLAELIGHPESSQFYDYKEGFIDGFLEAKEKYKYTEEFILMLSHKIAYKYYQKGKNHKGNMSVSGDELYGVRRELKDMIDSFYNEYPIAFEQGNEVDDITYTSITRRSDGLTLWVGKYIF